jgi:hypothetical protein
MDGENVLLVIAQLALGFVGFGAIITIFQPRPISTWREQDSFRFWILIRGSMGVIFASLVPLAIYHVSQQVSLTWQLSSALYVAVWVPVSIRWVGKSRRLLKADTESMAPWVALFCVLAMLTSLGLMVLNAGGWFFEPQFGVYMMAITFLLMSCALMFVRLLRFIGKGEDE